MSKKKNIKPKIKLQIDKRLIEFVSYQKNIVPKLRDYLDVFVNRCLKETTNKFSVYLINNAIYGLVVKYYFEIGDTWDILSKITDPPQKLCEEFSKIRNVKFVHRLQNLLPGEEKLNAIESKYNSSLEYFDVVKKMGDNMKVIIEKLISNREIIYDTSPLIRTFNYSEHDIEQLITSLTDK